MSTTTIGCHRFRCDSEAETTEHRGAYAVPDGWLVIDEVGDVGGFFCSTRCVDLFREEEERFARDFEEWRATL